MIRIFFALFLLLPSLSFALTYGPANEPCYTTQQPGTTSLVIVPDDVANPETAAESNTNATILIKAGTYAVTDLETNAGNFIANYDCQAVTIDPSSDSRLTTNDWTIAGLTFNCADVSTYCLSPTDDASGFTFRNNKVYEADSAFSLAHNAANGLVTGNEFESISGATNQSDLIRIGDTTTQGACTSGSPCHTGDSPSNIVFEYNWIHGCDDATGPLDTTFTTCNTSDGGNDMVSINGVNLPGVIFRYNALTNPHSYEQFVDFKNNLDNGVELYGNMLLGPFTGHGNDPAANSPCILVGDVGGSNPLNAGGEANCKVAGRCPVHQIHHNYCKDGYSVELGPGGQGRRVGGFLYSGGRYTSAIMEHNIDDNAQTYTTAAQQQTVDRAIFRHNTMRKSKERLNGEICTDTADGFNFQMLKNAFHQTRIPDGCTGSPDWNIQDNVFSQIVEGIDASRLGTGNTFTTITFADPDNASIALRDWTITTAAENQKGALPSPVIAGATIANDCVLDISMTPFNQNGFNHGPMAAVDITKITAKYNGTPQTISSSAIGSDTHLLLTMAACPSDGDTVTFDATYGWCRDSADIGGPELSLDARCLAVTGQAVTNNVDTVPPPQTTWYVDGDCGTNGNGTTETCGATGPWNSLENAVSTTGAACAGMSSGHILQIAGTTYEENQNLTFAPGCAGIIVQEKANENPVFDGRVDISGETWVLLGGNVYTCDTGSCQPTAEYYYRAWYDRGAGEEALDLEMVNHTCDTSLTAGKMRIEDDGTLCVHLSDNSNPASATYVKVPRKQRFLLLQNQNTDGVTIRKNPTGSGSFTIQYFQDTNIAAKNDINQNWTLSGLVIKGAAGPCISIFNTAPAGWKITNNTISECGVYGIRNTGDTGGALITGNTITDIQTEPTFQRCLGVGDGCHGSSWDDASGIRFASYSNTPNAQTTIASNTILRVGGGYQGRAYPIWLNDWVTNVVVDSNYIAHSDNINLVGYGIILTGVRANEYNDLIYIVNNRIYDVDEGITLAYSGTFPSQAGKTIRIANNTIADPRDFGIHATVADLAVQDQLVEVDNNIVIAQNVAGSLITIPASGASGWTVFRNNAFECDACATDQDYLTIGSTTVERAADCTASVDCIGDWNGSFATIVNNVEGNTNISIAVSEPTLDIDNTSIAYNAGRTLSYVTDDRAGTSRPQSSAYDSGAFEVVAAASAVVTQKSYRLYGRFLIEGVKPLAAEDTGIEAYTRGFFTARFGISVTSGNSGNLALALWARKNAGAWTLVDTSPTATVGVYIADNPARGVREVLTNQLALDGLTFSNQGVSVDDSNSAVNVMVDQDNQIEIEYSLGITTGAASGDTIELRIEQSTGTDLDAYSATPSVSVIAGQGSYLGGQRN